MQNNSYDAALEPWRMEQAAKERNEQMRLLCANDEELQQTQATLQYMANSQGISEAEVKAQLWNAHVATEAYNRCMAKGSPHRELDYRHLSDDEFHAIERIITQGRRN